MEGILKINNVMEWWHRSFSRFTDTAHPSTWKFTDALQRGQCLNRLKTKQLVAEIQQQHIKRK